MRYEGSVYRPPSEAHSLIVQATIGCAHNRCTFCSMYRDKAFRVREEAEVLRDLEDARRVYARVERVFLADGDALVLDAKKLIRILDRIAELFPECERVGAYGSPRDALRKTPEELAELRAHGLGIVYIGAESGSDAVLEAVDKGATREEIISAVRRIETSGMAASVTFVSGLAGAAGRDEHAAACGTLISEASPSYVGLLTLMIEPGTPLHRDLAEGRFRPLSPADAIAETLILLENAEPERPCVFRSNHPSNYLSLRGTLPADREAMMARLRDALRGDASLRDERFRML